jgi:hypothetical protein
LAAGCFLIKNYSILNLTMAKVISQETFDEAFKDNLELAEGSVDDARKETIDQFTAMGVNLGKG